MDPNEQQDAVRRWLGEGGVVAAFVAGAAFAVRFIWRYVRPMKDAYSQRVIIPADVLTAVRELDHRLEQLIQRVDDFIKEEERAHQAIVAELRASMSETRGIVHDFINRVRTR